MPRLRRGSRSSTPGAVCVRTTCSNGGPRNFSIDCSIILPSSGAIRLLEHYVTRHFDTPRSVHWAVAQAQGTAAAAHVFFSDQHALNAWLTKHGTGIGAADSRCRLALRWGEQLSGQVLANTPGRDLAITWEERNDSVFVFRTLPSPLAPDERILALCWSHWGCHQDDDATRRHFEAALAGLQQLLANRGVA